MQATLTILRRELAAYFNSPLAYVFIVIFLVLAGSMTFYVGGYTASYADLATLISQRLLLVIGTVILLGFLLLMLAFRSLLVPLQCEFFALEGLSQLLQTVERIRVAFNPALSILGVALTMFDRRNNLSAQVAEDVRACLGNVVFDNVVPRNVRLSEAPSHGLPALIYDLKCPGSEAYVRLAKEMIGRLPHPVAAAAA